jgi:hypothetical protein
MKKLLFRRETRCLGTFLLVTLFSPAIIATPVQLAQAVTIAQVVAILQASNLLREGLMNW